MVKPTVFIVEDDPDISRLVRHHLEAADFATTIFSNGRPVISEAERVRPALFVLEQCRAIRELPSLARIPIIFLTAKNNEDDRVRGLDVGADDYVSKPFSPRELVARVKAVLRRPYTPPPASPLRVGEIEIDRLAMTLTVRGKQCTTTATEFRMLDYFARHLGRVFTRDQLLDSCLARRRLCY